MTDETRRPGGAAMPRRSLLTRAGPIVTQSGGSTQTGPAGQNPQLAKPAPSLFQEALIREDQEFGAIVWSFLAYLGLAVVLAVALWVTP